MHEARIAESIIDEIEDLIRQGRITGRVRTVCLRVGRLTAVVHENLRFLFGVLSEGTLLEKTELQIETAQAFATCRACGAGFEIQDIAFLCPSCDSAEIGLVGGRELMIDAVEVE